MPAMEKVDYSHQSSDDLFNKEEVRKLLLNLNITKSPGPDRVHPKLLFELASVVDKPLCMIFNSSFVNGEVPEDWKIAIITALFKKGDKKSASNYRPVSLTSILCKIMEKLIRKRIIEHMDRQNLFSNQQFGFMGGRSTSLQLLKVLDKWTKMDENSDSEDTGDKETPAVRDLNELFDHSALRNLVSKFKEEITENVLQQYRTQILRWLDDKDSKQEETISIAQFCDWLMTKSVSRDDAIKTFQQFDTDGSGVVETSTMIETVKSMSGPNLQGELGRSIRMMQACSLTPGPSFTQEGVLGSGEELRTISPCHSNIEVSSNSSESYRLTNGDPNTYWQSDGTARSHWIRLHTKTNVVIKTLSVAVASSDSSYMPELIHIVAGKNFRSLRQLKEIRIPRVMKELGINVGDAAAVWYIQILASTVTMTLPLNPQLRPMVLEHTRRALDNIPPLSLCPASTERPKFLSKYVLQEVEKFVTDIALSNDGEVVQEGLHMLLSFNLARGNVGGILRTLKLLQEFPETNLPCSELLRKMLQARDSCWEKSGHQLPVTILGTDGGKSDDNSGPENLLNHTWTSLPVEAFYTTEEGKTKCNIIFKSTEFIQITRIRLKNAQGSKGVRRGLLFVYRDSTEKFNMEEHAKRFESYDDWGKMEYDFSVQVRGAGIAGKPDNPVAYFTFEDDCNEIDIPVTWHPVGQYILIKLLEPRQEKETKLSVAGVRFYGFPRKQVLIDEEVSVKHPPNPDKKPNCNSLEIIQHVLEFIVDLAQDQVKKGISSGKSDYLEFGDTPIDTLWELYTAFRDNDQEKWQSCAILMLQLMYCLLPVSSAPEGEKKEQGGGGGNYYPGIYGQVPNVPPQQELEVTYLYIPENTVGAVIGSKGSNIKEIMRLSSARIKILPQKNGEMNGDRKQGGPQNQMDERKVIITGSAESQWKAQFYIFDKIKSEGGFARIEEVHLRSEVMVPRSMVGRIIGKGGQNVREMQRVSGAIVKLPEVNSQQNPQDDSEVAVSIIGHFYAMQPAIRRIRSLVNQRGNQQGGMMGGPMGAWEAHHNREDPGGNKMEIK
ncbi:Insulin-like growth factor 2 mRNA-binding protein 1,Insulin-like growth factor 2 mRNA-binding protein 2 [Mytilus edulis]|uniref:Insulin-like growth factor 2 mRNA-binding protein 1,Insulin-like growth factor 2 mRNA-binding protein 2 n=1 Tax=Mytilus edulis TaxID=6550 RepID=A0A8S3U0E0_MYTED|nr:Insulin-like growth factor 2 mRNA-binding protein 1,Insulin-like growth factor 2 mRNA-binding protein 2 [Mytilus edulis]